MKCKSGNHLQLFEIAEKKMYVCLCVCVYECVVWCVCTCALMTPLCYLWKRNEVEEKLKIAKNHDRNAKCLCVCVCVERLYVCLCGGLRLQSPCKVHDLARASWRGSKC